MSIYKIDDFVQISQDQKLVIGKITEFEDKTFFFKVYKDPSEVLDGRQSHHSKYELIKTEENGKEFSENIKMKIQVISSLDAWIEEVCKPDAVGKQIYFYRQKLTPENQLIPPLKQICVCCKIFNPDIILKQDVSFGSDFNARYQKEMIVC